MWPSNNCSDNMSNSDKTAGPTNFIRNRIIREIEAGQYDSIVTRFPPEPNGYLHLGHAKSIVLNFSLPKEFGGYTNLRFDDTNPAKEEQRYIDAIKEDVRWLGYEWRHERYASDYFETFYEWGLHLIDKGLAYIDSQSAEEISQTRGSLRSEERRVGKECRARGARAGEENKGRRSTTWRRGYTERGK